MNVECPKCRSHDIYRITFNPIVSLIDDGFFNAEPANGQEDESETKILITSDSDFYCCAECRAIFSED